MKRFLIIFGVLAFWSLVGYALAPQSQPPGDPNVALANLGDQIKQKSIDFAICAAVNDTLLKENEQLKKELSKLKEDKK